MAEEDDCSVAIACWYFLRKSKTKAKLKRRKKQERRFWIHEVISKRSELGEYHRLVQELRHDPERFRRYFRMSTSQFDMLLGQIGPQIEKLDTNWRLMRTVRRRAALPIHTARRTAQHFTALIALGAIRAQHAAQYCTALLSV